MKAKTLFGYYHGDMRPVHKGMVMAWRLGLGPILNLQPDTLGRMTVLTTRGRRSGLSRRTPLTYAPGDGEIFLISGFGRVADWYRNIEADPRVELWLPDGRWRGVAERVDGPEERLSRLREVLGESGFAATRMAHIDPQAISDDDLRERTQDVTVIRVRLEERLDGSPADLWWVWPALGVGALIGTAIGRLAIHPPGGSAPEAE